MKKSHFLPLFLLSFVFVLSIAALPKKLNTSESEKINHILFDDLLKEHVSAAGNVNYLEFKNDRRFQNYLRTLSMANPYAENWTKEDRLVFWINAYNAFTIQLILDHYPVKSIKDINSPWKKKFFKINGVETNLDYIEHEMLRKMGEPRIHFAIVCASFSCPALRNEAYTVAKIESQLTDQAKKFVNDTKRNKITKNAVELSEIFNWFKSDFTTKGTLIEFINQYSAIQIDAKAKVKYLDYNWSLNN